MPISWLHGGGLTQKRLLVNGIVWLLQNCHQLICFQIISNNLFPPLSALSIRYTGVTSWVHYLLHHVKAYLDSCREGIFPHAETSLVHWLSLRNFMITIFILSEYASLVHNQKFRQWTKVVSACICRHVMEKVVDQTWDPLVEVIRDGFNLRLTQI